MAEKKEIKSKETKAKEPKQAKEIETTKETKLKEPKQAKEIKSKEVQVKEVQNSEEEILAPQSQGNFVYIGKKEAMAYVLAVVTRFEMGAKEVIIKARGKSISRAVDVAEIARNRDNTIKVEGIGIATEEVVTQEGRPLKISSIEIILKK